MLSCPAGIEKLWWFTSFGVLNSNCRDFLEVLIFPVYSSFLNNLHLFKPIVQSYQAGIGFCKMMDRTKKMLTSIPFSNVFVHGNLCSLF